MGNFNVELLWCRIAGWSLLDIASTGSHETQLWGKKSNSWLFRSPNEHWVARLGALRRGTTLPSPYEQLRVISRIIVHPGYLDFGFINDISLLQMTQPVIFSDYVRPVCLPPPGQVLENGHLCTVIGWGQLFEVGRIFRKSY